MSEHVKELSPEKLRLLQRRLQGSGGKSSQERVIPSRKRVDTDVPSGKTVLPLSFAEERLWLIDQLEPDSALYNIPFGLRLKGALDTAVLQQCLNEILRRHETLRAHFESKEGRPVQVVEPSPSLEMPLDDLSRMPEDQHESEALRICKAEARRPFDLTRDVLFRARLFKLGTTDHLLFLNVHHIVADGWSVNLLLRELTLLYEAFASDKPSPLPELPIQYADYAVWQREQLQGEVLEKQLAYWKKQLEGMPDLFELPANRPRPATPSYAGTEISREIPQALADGLAEFTRREGVTLFITLLAAFQSLLYRYTGLADVPVGTPIAGRNWKEVEDLVGFFVNTLVMRGDLSGDPPFRTLLGRTRTMALDAYAHQDIPFEMLVKELQPKRDMSHSPLFQIMLVLLELPQDTAKAGSLDVTTILLNSGTSKFDLNLSVRKRGKALELVAEYSTDLFDAPTIERMLGHYQRLLEGIVATPDEKISCLPLLSENERKQILVEWNDTAAAYPKDKCLHELFEAQVERTPEAVAVVFGEHSLTYEELNERANQLARHLKGLGVGADSLVGICVERSLEMVVGLLGILKAGGAYVPLDPEYPKERLAFMLEDSGLKVLLTQGHLAVPQGGTRLVRLDADWAVIAEQSRSNIPNVATPDNLAYVIYTSGSTGKPKGVAMGHEALVNLISWQCNDPAFSAGLKTLQFASLSFDVSFQEIFSTLNSGGTLVLITEELRRDFGSLLSFLEAGKVQRLFLPFVALEHLTKMAAQMELFPSGLRQIITAGEQLQITPGVRSFFEKLPDCSLQNQYGPTEAHVVTAFTLNGPPANWPKLPSIGKPISNATMFVLDKTKLPVPVGVPGDLYISGTCLARGYLNRPTLTDEKFVFETIYSEKTIRLYKTGDLARFLPDGNIEFLGRSDFQVKIRGFRVEPGEIEAALALHPKINQAVVMAREDQPGDKRLVAYITHRNGEIPSSELAGFLGKNLPGYMIPAAFVTLEAFPLSPNGKVDRRALPKPNFELPADKFVPPRTPTETTLARIWCEVLALKQIGINDNFFASGGHSLLATQVVSRMRKEFKLEMPLRILFESSTIAALAGHIDTMHYILRTQTPLQKTEKSREGRAILEEVF
jgi:amino acid adenylation domain-containing protein